LKAFQFEIKQRDREVEEEKDLRKTADPFLFGGEILPLNRF